MRKYKNDENESIEDLAQRIYISENIMQKDILPMTELEEITKQCFDLKKENEDLRKQLEECHNGRKCIEEHRNQLLKKFELIDFITNNY